MSFKEINETFNERETSIAKLFSEINRSKNIELIDFYGTYSGYEGTVKYKNKNYKLTIEPKDWLCY